MRMGREIHLKTGHFRGIANSAALLLVLTVFCGVPAEGQAQIPTGTIVGTVTDASGAVIPDANVTVTNTGTNISNTAATDPSGNYTVPLLQVGTYAVTVQATGFNKFLVSNLSLSAGMIMRIDAKLVVGQTSTTVEVSAASVPLLQTDTSTIGATLLPTQVENLPLNGRNFVNLVRTAPGVNEGGQTSLGSGTRPDDRRQSSTISADGQPDYANNYEIDGEDNNERMIGTIGVQPSIDAIQEVDVQTNVYRANSTRTAGAVVNVVTKAGTNKFHGSLYEFVRNDMFDANDYFNTPAANNPLAGKKPEYRQNQFGGSVGGPVIKDKTFFFGDFEDLRIVQGITSTSLLPSPCELGAVACNGYQGLGNFSDLLPNTVIYNPVTQQPYSYNGFANVIPPNEINSISKNYAALMPTNSTCLTATTCRFTNAPNRTQFASTFDVRIDHHFTSQTSLYSRYTFNNEKTFTPGAIPAGDVAGLKGVQLGGDPGSYSFSGSNRERAQNLALSLTHTFSPNVVGELTASYLRIHILSLPLNYGVAVNTAFGGPPVDNSVASGLAYVTISGYGSGGYFGSDEYLPLLYLENTFQYSGSMTITHGNHTISFGAGVIRRQGVLGQSTSPLGQFDFTGLLTESNEGAKGATGGNSFAQFLTGYMDDATRNLQLVAPVVFTWEPHAFIEDDWRARSWLTLNLGMRYDIFTPFTARHNFMSNFDPTIPSVLQGGQVIVAGQGGYGATAGIVTDLKDMAPRFGFAATMPHSMVLRGGFGMTFFPDNFFTPVTLGNQPFVSTTTINSAFGQPVGYAPPVFGESLGPATPTTTCLTDACYFAQTGLHFAPGAINSVNEGEAFNFHNAYAYQFSLGLQKEIGGNTLSIGYIGSVDRRLRSSGSPNQPLPTLGPGGCGATKRISLPNPCQPYYAELPNTSKIRNVTSEGVSTFNGLQVDFKRPTAHGLTLDTNYAYGRALADVSTGGSGGGVYGLIRNNYLYDWGNAQLDMRHRWTLSLSYALPLGKSLNGFAGQAAKGWSVNTITIWSSGLPVTVTDNSRNSSINIGGGSDRPNIVGGLGSPRKSIQEWFNIAAFAQQPFGTAGNERNNQIYGPSAKSVGFSVFKDFPVKEQGMTLQFRAEVFNLFNTPTFSEPNTTISAYSGGVPTSANGFGQITSTNINFPARQIQFAMKFLF